MINTDSMKRIAPILLSAVLFAMAAPAADAPRERLLMDFNWRFAPGHATDVNKDFNHATGGFSYFAKTGFGSGASDPKFNDQGWRKLNLLEARIPMLGRVSTCLRLRWEERCEHTPNAAGARYLGCQL